MTLTKLSRKASANERFVCLPFCYFILLFPNININFENKFRKNVNYFSTKTPVVAKMVPRIPSRNFGKISTFLYSRNYYTYTQELTQPLNRKPKKVTAKQALEKCLKPGKFQLLFSVDIYAISVCLKFCNQYV